MTSLRRRKQRKNGRVFFVPSLRCHRADWIVTKNLRRAHPATARALLDHRVGDGKQQRWHGEAEEPLALA